MVSLAFLFAPVTPMFFQISGITETRNALGSGMADELNGAEFHGHDISSARAEALISQANALAEYVNALDEEADE